MFDVSRSKGLPRRVKYISRLDFLDILRLGFIVRSKGIESDHCWCGISYFVQSTPIAISYLSTRVCRFLIRPVSYSVAPSEATFLIQISY